MRESEHVNLEAKGALDFPAMYQRMAERVVVPDLTGVEVYVFGVHSRKRDATYLTGLGELWRKLVKDTGATLKEFSMLRNIEGVFQ